MLSKSILKISTIFIITSVAVGCSMSEEKQARYDQCYEQYKCNWSSWISSALGGTKACNKCNDIVFE